jgi:hypothetical protein
VAYIDPKKSPGRAGYKGRVSANTAQEFKGIKAVLRKQGKKITDEIDNQNKEFSEFDAVPTAMAESMLELEQAYFDSALNNLAEQFPEAAAHIRSEYTLGQAMSSEVNQRKQFLAERKYSVGREFIDMYANQAAYLEVVAASVTKKIARNNIAWEMKSANWVHDPGLKKEMQSFSDTLLSMRNSSQLTHRIKQATLFVTMGLNVSGAVLDSSQPLMVGAAKIAETMGVAKAYKLVAKGYLEVFNTKNTELQELFARARNDGVLQSGAHLNDLYSVDDHVGYNVARAGDRRNLVNLPEALQQHEFVAGKVFEMVSQFGSKMFNGVMIPTKASGQLNNKIMLYAGLEQGKLLGLKGEELVQHAMHIAQVTNFQGGRGAQSSFKTKFGQMNNWVEVATLLTNYPISMMSHLYGNYRNMLKSSGLSPAQRQNAAKVFAAQLTLQVSMAGTLGLGLGALFKLAEKIFGFSPEEEIRKGLAEIDKSGTLADMILYGVANKATGVDFASRFGLGGVAGLNDYSGFDPGGVFGPSVTLWSGIAEMPKDLMDGRFEKSKLLPNSLRKIIEATTEDTFKDRNGQTLIDPTDSERIMKFIGFNPARLTQVRKQKQMYRFADEMSERENTRTTNERIELMMAGEFDTVLDQLREEVTELVPMWEADGVPPKQQTTMLEKEMRQRALRLVQAAVQKTSPLDPLAGGNKDTIQRRREIAASFGSGQAERTSSVEQEALAQRLLSGLEMTSIKRTPRFVRLQQLVDQLIENDPTLTEQQARYIAEQQM